MRTRLSIDLFRAALGVSLLATVGCAQLAPLTQGGGLNAPTGIPGVSPEPGAPGAATPGGSAGEPGAAASPEKKAETPADSGPKTVSVSIRSACSKTVSVFYGDKPKFGSGTKSSVSSNSVSSKTFKPGEMMWVIDDKEEGLASAKIAEGTKELEIGSDCKSIKMK